MVKNCLIVIGVLGIYSILSSILEEKEDIFVNLILGVAIIGLVNLSFCAIFAFHKGERNDEIGGELWLFSLF